MPKKIVYSEPESYWPEPVLKQIKKEAQEAAKVGKKATPKKPGKKSK